MIELIANITCPECGFVKQEEMPENYWVTTYTCASCGATAHPKPGDCCVYCSYADQHCPGKQKAHQQDK